MLDPDAGAADQHPAVELAGDDRLRRALRRLGVEFAARLRRQLSRHETRLARQMLGDNGEQRLPGAVGSITIRISTSFRTFALADAGPMPAPAAPSLVRLNGC